MEYTTEEEKDIKQNKIRDRLMNIVEMLEDDADSEPNSIFARRLRGYALTLCTLIQVEDENS